LVGGDLPGCLEAVQLGRADVHQHDIGPELARQRNGLASVRGLSRDIKVGLGVKERAEAGADDRLVLGEQDTDDQPAWREALPGFGVRSACAEVHATRAEVGYLRARARCTLEHVFAPRDLELLEPGGHDRGLELRLEQSPGYSVGP
jgi:hypothetical protein